MTDEIDDPEELPSKAGEFSREFPEVWDAYSEFGKACSEAGPIDDETRRLVKLALAVGAQSEGAVHSHVRRGLDEDVEPEKLRHVGVLAAPTIGFPKAVAGLSWIDDIAEE